MNALPPGVPFDESHLRRACAELDDALRGGQPGRAEQYLAGSPVLACQDDWTVELIYTEFVTREELGHRPTPEEYYARFPHLKERLRRQFHVHTLMRDGLDADPGPAADAGAVLAGVRHLGRYELLEEVARGGMGVVFRARQGGLERAVAVKVLRPDLARLPLPRQRFCAEARRMAALAHRHILPVHELADHAGLPYFSMEFAAGGSLAGRADVRPRAARILAAVADAVAFAHRRDVLHGDLKPSNVLLDESGEPLLTDFGLARGLSEPALGPFAGTPAYMAPEQVRGDNTLSGAADVWALGVMLYELLAGQRPFLASRWPELRQQIGHAEAPPLPAGTPRHLDAICRRCLDKDAGRRPAAEELANWLRR